MAKAKETATIGADYEYETTKVTGADGKTRTSRGNGDSVARAMLAFVAASGDTQKALAKVVKDNKLGDKYDVAKSDNLGLLRMAIGNTLRAMVRAGTPVQIGEVLVKTLEQRVALPEVKPKKVKEAA